MATAMLLAHCLIAIFYIISPLKPIVLWRSTYWSVRIFWTTLTNLIISSSKMITIANRGSEMDSFFHEILRACSRGVYETINGRADYQNLLPMTIGGI